MTARSFSAVLAMIASIGCVGVSAIAAPPIMPLVDYHQHIVSPVFSRIVNFPVLDGPALVSLLDAAGVKRAVVLSTGYSMADDRKALPDPDRLTRDENDWTAAQIARAGGRLVGFCGVNPLRPAALDEVRRCLALPGMIGLKLHFGNSGVSLRNPAHAARMMQLFSLVGRAKAPILVHMRARGGENFGGQDARLFIDKLLPLTPDSDVIIAHLGGAGPGYPAQADEVMAVFAAACKGRDPRLRRTYFDLATVVAKDNIAAENALIARRIREVGPRRVLYGSDLLTPDAPTISEAWGYVTGGLGLTKAELRVIAGNRLSFLR